MTSIEAMKYIDSVLGILHLDPNKVSEVSVELNETERKISVRDITGKYYTYIFSLSAGNCL
ncbi:MAG: hypothetical protein WCF23_23460 [Candidatus Nitrosopolaris sp.]